MLEIWFYTYLRGIFMFVLEFGTQKFAKESRIGARKFDPRMGFVVKYRVFGRIPSEPLRLTSVLAFLRFGSLGGRLKGQR